MEAQGIGSRGLAADNNDGPPPSLPPPLPASVFGARSSASTSPPNSPPPSNAPPGPPPTFPNQSLSHRPQPPVPALASPTLTGATDAPPSHAPPPVPSALSAARTTGTPVIEDMLDFEQIVGRAPGLSIVPELIGTDSKTPLDSMDDVKAAKLATTASPEFWRHCDRLAQNAVGFAREAQKHHRFFTSQMPSHRSSMTSMHSSAGALRNVNRGQYKQFIAQQEEEFAPLADAMAEMQQLQHILQNQLSTTMMHWQNYFQQLEAIKAKCAAYDDMEKAYNAGMKKYLSMKASTPWSDLAEMDHDLSVKAQFLKLHRFDIHTMLREISSSQSVAAFRPFADMLGAYRSFFESGSRIIANNTTGIEALQKFVLEAETKFEEEVASHHQIRRNIEKNVMASVSPMATEDPHSFQIRDLQHDSYSSEATATADWESKCGYLYLPRESEYGFARVWCYVADGVLHVMQPVSRLHAHDLGLTKVPPPRERANTSRFLKRRTKKALTDLHIKFDLQITSVKQTQKGNLRFTFEIVSPQQSVTLQSENQAIMKDWLNALQSAIGSALNSSAPRRRSTNPVSRASSDSVNRSGTPASPRPGPRLPPRPASPREPETPAILLQLREIAGNSKCADCGRADPEWASINLGLLLCVECAGCHRSLGTHISKVRSVKLDKLDEHLVNMMMCIGNQAGNAIWEHKVAPGQRPTKETNQTRSMWIRAKYEMKSFVPPCTMSQQDKDDALFRCINENDALQMLQFIIHGANVNVVSSLEENRTPLLQAAMNGNTLCSEILIQNGADTTSCELRGWNSLHYAAYYNDASTAKQIIRQFNPNVILAADANGQTPLDIALSSQDDAGSLYEVIPVLQAAVDRAKRKQDEKAAEQHASDMSSESNLTTSQSTSSSRSSKGKGFFSAISSRLKQSSSSNSNS
jgi:Putative GTPase activating protein for Arf/Ankyrin repeats (3 copies)/PH domain